MSLQDSWARLGARIRTRFGGPPNPYFPFAEQALDASDVAQLVKEAGGELEKLVFRHKRRVLHKWLQFPAIYEKEFAIYQNTAVKMLEIGVFKGGSLELWCKYFGDGATIYGIDNNPECAGLCNEPNQVRIGSQADPAFLSSVVDEMGSPDIILDDGSHVSSHQEVSFRCLFPQLKTGGLYVIEDLHTAYWPGFYEGGYRRKGTAIELAKTLVDDMHGWYHNKGQRLGNKTEIASVRFYDSIVVIEKGDIPMPRHIKVS